jgi:hypothetical protein
MATITTTTQTNVLSLPGVAAIARDLNFADLYAVVRTGTDTLSSYISTDNGSSWLLMDTFTHTGLQEWAGPVIDRDGNGHVVYRIGDGTNDRVYYRRMDLATELWGGGVQVSGTDANGGVIGSRWQGLDLAVYQYSYNRWYVVWTGGYNDGAGRYGCAVAALTLREDGSLYISNNIISGTRFWMFNGSGRIGPSIEVEHNGSGFDVSGTPNLWVTFGRTRLSMVKMAWNGSGWTGPSTTVTMRPSMNTADYTPSRWDGTRWLTVIVNSENTSTVQVFQRNQANSNTTYLTTPTHPTGAIRHLSVSYNNSTKDIRVYAVGTSSDVLYFVTYVRATSTWGAWSTVTATAVLGSGSEWSVRKGGTHGNGRYDVLTAHSGTPNSVVNHSQTISAAPNVPAFIVSDKAYFNGGPANVAATLPLTWTFSDADPGQTQGSYALSRQIGAGTVNYWNASNSTWSVTEIQNSSATQGVTLPASWGADADANHQYKVKVWDNANVPSTSYSNALTLIPSAQVNPSITAPVNAATLTSDTLTVTWTAAQQTGARITLTQTAPVTTNVLRYDSGAMMGYTATTFDVPYRMPTGTSWSMSLTTYNNEGLASAVQTRTFSVVYAPPPAAPSTFATSTAAGTITVTPTIYAPTGAQPAVVGYQLYRRKQTAPTLNSNPDFAGSVTGWQVGGGATGTLSYSTAQFISSPGAARYVPNGVGALPQIETTGLVAITAGKTYLGSGWIRPETTAKPIVALINWYTSGNVYISSTQFSVATPVANAWQFITVVGNPLLVPTAAKMSVSIGRSGTPLAADAWWADEVRLTEYDTEPGVRLLNETGAPAAYADWGAAHGVLYEYQWVIQGANGTLQPGPWQA